MRDERSAEEKFRGHVDPGLARSSPDRTLMTASETTTIRHERERTMRVMVFVPGNEDSEAGKLPSEELIAKMTTFNEELVRAGVMLDGQGLTPTSKGKRVRFEGAKRTVIDGPFAESKELVAGYWIWQVKSIEEAVEWLKRAPFEDGEVTLRPIFETEDFAEVLSPELRAREEQLLAEVERQRKT